MYCKIIDWTHKHTHTISSSKFIIYYIFTCKFVLSAIWGSSCSFYFFIFCFKSKYNWQNNCKLVSKILNYLYTLILTAISWSKVLKSFKKKTLDSLVHQPNLPQFGNELIDSNWIPKNIKVSQEGNQWEGGWRRLHLN